jgi:RNA polymerase sigma factor (sigma-70 family)
MDSAESLDDLIEKEMVKEQGPFCLEEGTTKLSETTEEQEAQTFTPESGGGDIVAVYIEQLRALSPLSVEEERFLCKKIKDQEKTIEKLSTSWCEAIGASLDLEEELLVVTSNLNNRLPFSYHLTEQGKQFGLDGIVLQFEKVTVLRKELVRLESVLRNGTSHPDHDALRKVEESGDFEISKCISQMRLSSNKIENLMREVEGRLAAQQKDKSDWINTTETLKNILVTIRECLLKVKKNKEELIRSHLPLSIHMAKRYRHRGVDFLDLVQEGNQGLMRAVDTFDYRRGNRFTSYAMWWVKQSIIRAIYNQSRTMRIPVYLFDRLNNYHAASEKLHQEKGREPTLKELAGTMKVSMDCLLEMTHAFKNVQTLEEYHQTNTQGHTTSSQNGSFSGMIVQSDLHDKVDIVLSQLPSRESEVLKLRFGINGAQYEHSLQEIGQMFNLSRERIRQIENSALHKLRKMGCIDELREFLG